MEPSLQSSGAKHKAEVPGLRPPEQPVTFKTHRTREKSPRAANGLRMLVLKDVSGGLKRCGDGSEVKPSENPQEF